MGAIVTSPHPEVATATDGFLPQESPLAMSAADLGRPPHAVSKPVSVGAGMMVFQSIAVVEILLGRDAGWQTQRRDDGAVERRELYRKYGVPTACGVAMAISAWAVSLPLLLWMSPVIVGLLFAIPIGAWTARPAMHALFVTPEEAKPPRVLVRANELAASPAHASAPALATLRQDPALLHRHLSSLPPARRGGPGEIDLHLAVARARIEASDSFDQAVRHLTPRETLAVLGDSALLEGVLAK